ncbi:MAG: hypothetical protein GY867_00795 [bacterium]|nr:hypothetical protein [bacterium]
MPHSLLWDIIVIYMKRQPYYDHPGNRRQAVGHQSNPIDHHIEKAGLKKDLPYDTVRY